jgi:hypothetical protein
VALEHMMATDPDPFMTSDSPGVDERPLIRAGRYRMPELIINPDGTIGTGGQKKGGRQRVTTLVKAIADARALDLWHQRQLLVGIVRRPELYDLLCATVATTPDPADLKKALDELAPRVLAASGAEEGAGLGTAFHGFTEAQDLGLMHYARQIWHGKLRNYSEGMADQGLEVDPEYIERVIVCERYNAAGTFDRLLWDTAHGVYRVGDLKSQKKFWTWLEIAAQMAAYQLADAIWDRRKLCFVEMPKVAEDHAVVVWMPITHPDALDGGSPDGVDFFNVDLERGREALELCFRVDRMRSEAKGRHQTWGLLRPSPQLARVEAFARRLDAVSSLAEGSAVWAEISKAGLGQEAALTTLAGEIAARFKS